LVRAVFGVTKPVPIRRIGAKRAASTMSQRISTAFPWRRR
jgi:hypothetical protein